MAKLFREQAHDQYDHAVGTRDSLIDHVMRGHGPRGSHKVLTPRAVVDIREAASNLRESCRHLIDRFSLQSCKINFSNFIKLEFKSGNVTSETLATLFFPSHHTMPSGEGETHCELPPVWSSGVRRVVVQTLLVGGFTTRGESCCCK